MLCRVNGQSKLSIFALEPEENRLWFWHVSCKVHHCTNSFEVVRYEIRVSQRSLLRVRKHDQMLPVVVISKNWL